MKAVLHHETGGSEVLRHVTVPDPVPGRSDVVVQVEACALNRLDIVQRAGGYQMPGFHYPHIPGMDVAGTVVAVGDDVRGVAIGDRVVIDPLLSCVPEGSRFAGRNDDDHADDRRASDEVAVIGGTEDGGYAELCLAPASHVFPVPDDMPITHAATFPTCWLTASHGLFAVGGLQRGENVLIHAAGAGVSVAAIQLAKRAGATVLATAGTDEKCARAVQLGADHVVNNRTGDVAAWVRSITDGAGVDLVFDHVGTALFGPSLFALGHHGRLVSCGNSSGDAATIPSLGYLFHHGISIRGSDRYRPDEFGPLWQTFCTERFEVPIHAEFALADAAGAQDALDSRDVFGKILLRP
ncbi:MAG: zinc-binding alcohol dehydrogenase family protein [Acidimicrobiia bacterium]